MSQRWFVGLSSGSSLTGVDAALVESTGAGMDWRCRVVHCLHQPYARDLRDWLMRGASGQSLGPRQVALLNRYLGESFAAAARTVIDQARFPSSRIFCLGMSGHTFWHDPEGRYPATLNLGMPDLVAERTGLTVVSDFRGRDLVMGGQGVMMTPLVDYLLFQQPAEHRVLIHLGGIATVLLLPAEKDQKKLIGFQAAPCTLLLDGLMTLLTGGREPFDTGGKHAVQGRCIDSLLELWLAHPLLQKKPPRYLSRGDFGEEFIRQAVQHAKQQSRNFHDLLCTANHFVARAICNSLARFLPEQPKRVLLSGGGVRNGLLWRLLEHGLGAIPMEKTDGHGVPIEARKAVAFAGLAALTMDGVPANLPGVTGATGPRLLGHITPGVTANWARCLATMAAQTAPLRLAA